MFCKCGQKINVTSRWNGLANVLIFQDENGQEISECPGCGENETAWLENKGGTLMLSNRLLSSPRTLAAPDAAHACPICGGLTTKPMHIMCAPNIQTTMF